MILEDVYDLVGGETVDTAEERAENMFAKVDRDKDGKVTEEEFLRCGQRDQQLVNMLEHANYLSCI